MNRPGMRKASVLRPAGWVLSFNGDGPDVEQDTLQCCHCGRHWVYEPGSGKKRGFCTNCNGVTCGNSRCDVCVPIEQQLENMESGRNVLHRPIVSSVGIDLKA